MKAKATETRRLVCVVLLFLAEAGLPVGLAFVVSPLIGIVVLAAWGLSYFVLVPRYFRQQQLGVRIRSHLLWCIALVGFWALALLSTHLTTLYVPSNHPPLDSVLLRSVIQVAGIFLTVLCLLRLIWLVLFPVLLKTQTHDPA